MKKKLMMAAVIFMVACLSKLTTVQVYAEDVLEPELMQAAESREFDKSYSVTWHWDVKHIDKIVLDKDGIVEFICGQPALENGLYERPQLDIYTSDGKLLQSLIRPSTSTQAKTPNWTHKIGLKAGTYYTRKRLYSSNTTDVTNEFSYKFTPTDYAEKRE